MPCGKHLPIIYSAHPQKVQDNWQQVQEVDCQVSEFVGPTLMQVMERLETLPAEDAGKEVRHLFVKLLLVMKRFYESNVAWYADFHALNICYCQSQGVWKIVDLEHIEVHDLAFPQALNKGSKRLFKDLPTDGVAFSVLGDCLKRFCITPQ